MASDGPPHPPEFKKIRMGEISFPLKYSAICFVAASVTSTIIFLLFSQNSAYLTGIEICTKIVPLI
jgi:hypothetical protein